MNCKECNQHFILTSPRKIYCSKKCQRTANLKLNKIRYEADRKTPSWTCQNCGFTQKLPFYPIANAKQWLKWKCKKCGNKAQVLTK